MMEEVYIVAVMLGALAAIVGGACMVVMTVAAWWMLFVEFRKHVALVEGVARMIAHLVAIITVAAGFGLAAVITIYVYEVAK